MTSRQPLEKAIRLRPWCEADLLLLHKLNAPEMTDHLGGPETGEQIVRRHRRYVDIEAGAGGQMFVIVTAGGVAAGSVGYWPRRWHDQDVYETGWAVLPGHQGSGFATAATRLLVERARAGGDRRMLHAYPSVHHPASNAICRRVGFTLLGPTGFEYPPGQLIEVNDWQLDLQLDQPRQD